MAGLKGPGASHGDPFTNHTDKAYHPLGTRREDIVGRVFRYYQAGGADSVAGKLYQSAAPIPFHLGLTAAAQAIGDGQGKLPIVVTPGATAGAANLYAEGFLGISVTPGAGITYLVSGHAAITASTAFNLFLQDYLQVALTTSSKYGLVHNPYKNVILVPTVNTAAVVGVPNCVVTTATWGWLQTWGPCSMLMNGTPAITMYGVNSGTTTGAVDKWTTAAADVAVQVVGKMMQVGVSTEYDMFFLMIAA